MDDNRLSNCKAVIHNSLTGEAIRLRLAATARQVGQIASSSRVTRPDGFCLHEGYAGQDGWSGLTDTRYHYDHIGNVMIFSDSSGALVGGSVQN